MFRQILESSDHCDYQRILWRFNPDSPIQDYRLNTITYGLGPSPFLSNRTLLQLAHDECAPYPQAARVLREDTYIDDICTGASSLDNALCLQSQLISLMKKGHFELRKWSSNHPALLSHLPESHLSVDPRDFDNECTSSLKILGL
ncbi:hypothetical protein JTB14_024397 [Gonioctena quinquepunctata]|nr:hypothetical protein JTB14_024397 [Gonioctena quinquepunctata]